MNNTKQTINNHNKCILNSSKPFNDTANNNNTKDTRTCSCQQKNTYSLNGNCLLSSLIYQATVTLKDNSTTKTYIGLTERCNLCLKEKLLIIHPPELSSLNKRNEHMSSCYHRNKQLLCNNWTKH